MRILQIGKFYPPDVGGIESALFDITEELNRREVRCDVLCSNSNNEYSSDIVRGYRITRTRSLGMAFSVSLTPQMIYKLCEIADQYDILHIHHPDPMANLALLCAAKKHQKIVLHWHSDIIRQKAVLKLYAPLQSWMLKRASAIIATSPPYILGSTYLTRFQYKSISIPRGIRPLQWNADLVASIRERFPSKNIVFALGRFIYYKGFEYLIESANFLDSKTIVLIGGDGPLRKKFEALISQNNLQGKVHLLGRIPQEQLGSYFQACDVFCMPSIERSEAFGLAQVEAMSLGKPVVATTIPGSGVAWVNQNGESGINVPPRDAHALAQAINSILQDSSLRDRLSQGASERFRAEFTIEKEVDRLLQLYQSL